MSYCICCGAEKKDGETQMHDKECIWFEDCSPENISKLSLELLSDGKIKKTGDSKCLTIDGKWNI